MSGAIAGLVAGYFLFSSANPEHATDGLVSGGDRLLGDRVGKLQIHGAAMNRSEGRAGREDRDSDPESTGTFRIDWDEGRASLPLDYLQQLDLRAFASEGKSRWAIAGDPGAFEISSELNEILQLDPNQCEAVKQVLLDAWENHVASHWEIPAGLSADDRGVVIEIAPASADVEASIRASLSSIMGDERTAFFLNKIQPTLDWEYGGFGDSRRLVEVSILPDDTISIRESLRQASGTGGNRGSDQGFELEARQHRVDRLPPSLAALVMIED